MKSEYKKEYKKPIYLNEIFYLYKEDYQGNYHAEDEPAIIYFNGEKRWYRHGKLHRENGPAIENLDGTEICLYHLNHTPFYNLKSFLEELENKVIYVNSIPYLKDGRKIQDFF